MKKATHILTALLLLVSTIGVSISRHYCGDILSDIYLSAKEKKCCDMGDSENTCCDTESETFVLENDFQWHSTTFSFKHSPDFVILDAIHTPEVIEISPVEKLYTNYIHPPPKLKRSSIQATLQSFLI